MYTRVSSVCMPLEADCFNKTERLTSLYELGFLCKYGSMIENRAILLIYIHWHIPNSGEKGKCNKMGGAGGQGSKFDNRCFFLYSYTYISS